MSSLLIVLVMFLGLVVFGAPMAVALGLSAFAGMLLEGLNPINVVAESYRLLDSFTLLAVPFFLMLGFLVARSSLTDRLLDLSRMLVGHIRGALGHINVVISMLFAGLSGSATADTSGIGAVLLPMMDRRGYSRAYSAALTAATSTIGLIIPPSIFMIIYAATSNTSVAALFMAGIVPGAMIGCTFLALNFVYAWRNGVDRSDSIEQDWQFRRAGVTLWRGLPALVIPVFIIVGITRGIFTATEAGAVALAYTLVLIVFIYGDIRMPALSALFRDAVLLYSLPLLAAAMAAPFGWVLALLGAQDVVRDLIASLQLSPAAYLILVIAIFTVIGTFLDGIPAIIIFVPLVDAGAAQLGIHPIHLGIVITMTLAMGLVTPPYGLCLLISSKLAKCSVMEAVAAVTPLLIAEFAIIVLVAVFPDIALFIPRMFVTNAF